MKSVFSSLTTAAALAALLAGCSSDSGFLGSSLTTSSVDPAKTAAAAPKTDPACVALTAKIDALRKDGVTERVEKASAGKTTTVAVKRESLAKMTELDKTNFEYQTRCSAAGLAKPAAVMPSAAIVPAVPAAKVAATPAKPKKIAAAAAVAPPPAQAAEAAAMAAPAAAAAAPAAMPAPVAAAPIAVAPRPLHGIGLLQDPGFGRPVQHQPDLGIVGDGQEPSGFRNFVHEVHRAKRFHFTVSIRICWRRW